MSSTFTIFCNQTFPPGVKEQLIQGAAPHRVVFPERLAASNLVAGDPDPLLEQAQIAYGQPHPDQVRDLPNLRWVHLTSAGYTRYETDPVRAGLRNRRAVLSNSSSVYEEPCAEHLLAMILAFARRLPHCAADQIRDPGQWNATGHRRQSHLLQEQAILIFGYGTIARRLVELLAPLHMSILCVRRSPRGDEGVRMISTAEADQHLPSAHHVVNILPQNAESDRYFNSARFARMKAGAFFYNIGRGTTVDQDALAQALGSNHLAGSYLDVTDPEPLPADHPLWTVRNSFITPHTAGGSADEGVRNVEHFLQNLRRFENGESLRDVVLP